MLAPLVYSEMFTLLIETKEWMKEPKGKRLAGTSEIVKE